jgi:hypothetical protein
MKILKNITKFFCSNIANGYIKEEQPILNVKNDAPLLSAKNEMPPDFNDFCIMICITIENTAKVSNTVSLFGSIHDLTDANMPLGVFVTCDTWPYTGVSYLRIKAKMLFEAMRVIRFCYYLQSNRGSSHIWKFYERKNTGDDECTIVNLEELAFTKDKSGRLFTTGMNIGPNNRISIELQPKEKFSVVFFVRGTVNNYFNNPAYYLSK